MSFKQRFLEEIQKPYSVTGIDIKKANYFLYAMLSLFILLHFLIYYVLIDPQAYIASGGVDGYPKWLEAIVNWHSSFNPVLEEQAKASGSMRLYHGAIYTVWVMFSVPMILYGLIFGEFSTLINKINNDFKGKSLSYCLIRIFIIYIGLHFVFWYVYYHFFSMGVASSSDGFGGFFIYESMEVLLVIGAPSLILFFVMVGNLINFYSRFVFVFFSSLFYCEK
ncbi:hypothetical protein [Pseudoalteromonas sp. S16_S37]|uniref:hypothetical protein n=1 Tax=Pseudoalteromonas sp. S16_S37 TaxID=2720228 RepID=UPI00168117A8|nr:hypothetical protein [Pseudoalteromonas sp. S16_S37]MBD1583401.1 hypothetical protein [Pseudoalteromonas sp. S16_S37]